MTAPPATEGKRDPAATTPGNGDRPRPAAAGLLLPGLLTLVALAILVSLGTWQVQRLAWKEGLIARVDERIDAPPVAAPGPATWDTFRIDDWQFRPVRLEGRFLPGELHVWIALTRPQGPLGGPGYFVVAPFQTADGWVVLVNRGFVPDTMKETSARPGSGPPTGLVTLTGLVREHEHPNFVTPEPDFEKNVWFARDIPVMATALGFPSSARIAPFLVDAVASETPPGGLPQAGETRISFPNNHLQYAITWYGLAATGLVVFVVFAVRRLRGRQEPRA